MVEEGEEGASGDGPPDCGGGRATGVGGVVSVTAEGWEAKPAQLGSPMETEGPLEEEVVSGDERRWKGSRGASAGDPTLGAGGKGTAAAALAALLSRQSILLQGAGPTPIDGLRRE